MGKTCFAPDCRSAYAMGSGISFYTFPMDPVLCKRWSYAVKRTDDELQASAASLICSKHFVTGRPSKNPDHPDYIPSIFPVEVEDKKLKRKLKRLRDRHQNTINIMRKVPQSSTRGLPPIKPAITYVAKPELVHIKTEPPDDDQEANALCSNIVTTEFVHIKTEPLDDDQKVDVLYEMICKTEEEFDPNLAMTDYQQSEEVIINQELSSSENEIEDCEAKIDPLDSSDPLSGLLPSNGPGPSSEPDPSLGPGVVSGPEPASCDVNELLECIMCNLYFMNTQYFKSHLISEHFYRSCPNCDQILRTQRLLIRHMGEEHPKRPKKKCHVCSFTTKSSKELIDHVLTDHEKCSICLDMFEDKEKLAEHLWKTHQDKVSWKDICKVDPYPLRCNVCFFGTSKRVVFQAHKLEHTCKFTYKCTKCSYTTEKKKKYDCHIHCDYNCHHCKFATNSRAEIQQHLIKKHIRKYKCSFCSYSHSHLLPFKAHLSEKHKQKCSKCSFSCFGTDNLNVHNRQNHIGYSCKQCSFSTHSSMLLASHVRRKHPQNQSLQCDQCSYRVKLKFSMTHHIIWNHLQYRVCKYCRFNTYQKLEMDAHYLTHTALRRNMNKKKK